MSTKIYNGLLIDFPGSFSDLRTELIRLAKEEIKPVAELEFTKMFAKAVFFQMDINAWANRHIVAQNAHTLSEVTVNVWTIINDEIVSIKTSNKRSPLVDFEFCITLFPLSNKILAIPYCEQKSILSVLKNQPYVKEYGYWNNTDKPDELSDSEWETRSKDWDAAFVNNGIGLRKRKKIEAPKKCRCFLCGIPPIS